jgi:hypothetical protein
MNAMASVDPLDSHFAPTLTAMLVYLASEDPTRTPLDRVDLAAQAPDPRFGGRGGSTAWPVCVKAPRSTEPRLK